MGVKENSPAGQVEELVLVGRRGLVLQLPEQHVDQVGVLDDDGHLLEHVLIAHHSLLQSEDDRRGRKRKEEMYRILEVLFFRYLLVIFPKTFTVRLKKNQKGNADLPLAVLALAFNNLLNNCEHYDSF